MFKKLKSAAYDSFDLSIEKVEAINAPEVQFTVVSELMRDLHACEHELSRNEFLELYYRLDQLNDRAVEKYILLLSKEG